MWRRFCFATVLFAVATSGEDVDGPIKSEGSKIKTEPTAQVNRTLEELRFPVLFNAIINRSVVLEHFPDTHDLRVRSIEEEKVEDVEVEVKADASTATSYTITAKPCSLDANGTATDENSLPPPSLQPTDRLIQVDGQNITMLSFQDVIDSPVGSIAVLPLFKPVGSTHVLSGFARVEILSPKMLEFEPATQQRKEVVTAWVEEKARLKAEREACELEIANNKALQAKLAEERRVAEALARKEQELLEKLDKEEYERTRMTPHNFAAGKRRDGWEFRYEVEFTTKGPIGLYWDLNTRDKAVVSHLEPKLPAQKFNVIAPRDQIISLNGIDTSKMGPEQVVEVYLSSAFPRKMVFLVQMSAERAAAKAADKNPVMRVVMNWTLAFDAPEILRGWGVRLHLASWSIPPDMNETNSSVPLQLEFATPITGCRQFPAAAQSSNNETSGVIYLAYRGACTLIEKANHAKGANGKALLIVNNANGEGRFTSTGAAVVEHVEFPVTLMGKLDGELIMSIVEHHITLIRIYEERPDQIPVPLEQPPKLTNQELAIARDVKKAGRNMTFWYIYAGHSKGESGNVSSFAESYEFQVLPALFGGKIPTLPYRIVAAYPQETACNYKGLGILATRSVVVVKRGGCSFGTKLRAIQHVGGAGMLLVNSDESLIPLMTDSRELEGLKIWGASINLRNGTAILEVLAKTKNLPTLVKIAAREDDSTNITTSN
ncbi:PDZ domain-containing protein [Phytophthora infestans]|uniref:PDZ domain-containing protein n=1 Tax=Phytophthora infestans TaxID=4787 RepID=A0A8S9U3J6_PHYIN|nr:PDZ domain-containing protein [Phytophthora infestans]